MSINFFFEDVEENTQYTEGINNWLKIVSETENVNIGELNYIFCSDNYLLEINKKYLNHDYYTDIISFDYSKNRLISGDIFISIDTVKDNAKRFNQLFENELNRVIVHGVLHFIGYNDKNDEQQLEMTEKENFYLKKFKN